MRRRGSRRRRTPGSTGCRPGVPRRRARARACPRTRRSGPRPSPPPYSTPLAITPRPTSTAAIARSRRTRRPGRARPCGRAPNAISGRAAQPARHGPGRAEGKEETGRRREAGRIEDARREGHQSAIRRREQGQSKHRHEQIGAAQGAMDLDGADGLVRQAPLDARTTSAPSSATRPVRAKTHAAPKPPRMSRPSDGETMLARPTTRPIVPTARPRAWAGASSATSTAAETTEAPKPARDHGQRQDVGQRQLEPQVGERANAHQQPARYQRRRPVARGRGRSASTAPRTPWRPT